MFSQKLVALIQAHEGLRLTPYRCTSNDLTIGYGRNLDKNGINIDEAYLMLLNDLDSFYDQLKEYSWYKKLNRVRQEAILELAYNCGIAGVLTFKKMIAALYQDEYTQASDELIDSLWYSQVAKERSHSIKNRLERGTY